MFRKQNPQNNMYVKCIVNLLKRNHIENLKECNDLKLSNNTEFICLTKYKYANTDSS